MLTRRPVAVMPVEKLFECQEEREAEQNPEINRHLVAALSTAAGIMCRSAPPSRVPAARATIGNRSFFSLASGRTRVRLPTRAMALISIPLKKIQRNVVIVFYPCAALNVHGVTCHGAWARTARKARDFQKQ